MSCKELMDIILSIVQFIAIIIASIAAIYGIDSWKNESKWKKRNELAEEILYLLYESRDSIIRMRSPFGHSEEGKTRKQSDQEPDDLKDSLDKAYVMFERFEANKEAINKLFSLKYRALMYFGENVEDSIKEIEKVINKLFVSAHFLGRIYWPKLGKCSDEKELTKITEIIDEHEKVFWIMEMNDKISEDVNNAIEKADKELKKWIR